MATQLGEQLGVPAQMVEGRRITDSETLKIVTMVYGGYLNKQLVVQLQQLGCNALGLTGADGNAVLAHKRENTQIEYGWVGDIDQVNSELFKTLLKTGIVPVVAPLTHNGKGQLLNTNADTLAQELAVSLSNGKIFAGMVPKLDNAFKALEAGVNQVLIGKAEKLHELIQGKAGTTLVK